MSSALSLLFVTVASSIVMLLVLSSLASSKVEGIREWFYANWAGLAGFLLFAGRGALPGVVQIELANALYMAAVSLMLVGFRRHLGQPVPLRALSVGAAAALAGLAVFHLVVESALVRVVLMSLFHGLVCLAMGLSIRRGLPQAPARYPFLFTSIAALLLAALHALRLVVYLAEMAHLRVLLDEPVWSMIFFAFGVLVMPALTLGAVMMANARLIANATYAADHDFLTGAFSRRAFFRLAEREHARALRSGAELSLLLFDVDYFKRINDTFGHAAGDEVLVDIVRRTATVVRQVDVCGRFGGEEFVVLLPDTNAQDAAIVAERLRSVLASALRLAHRQDEVCYTVSIGIAQLGQRESIGDMLIRADKALYQAKSSGRNAAVCALPAEATPASC